MRSILKSRHDYKAFNKTDEKGSAFALQGTIPLWLG